MAKQDKQSSLRVLLDILSFLIVGVLAIFYNIITTSVDGFLKQTFGEENYFSKVLITVFILIIVLWRIQNYLKSNPTELPTDFRHQLLENLERHYKGRIKSKMQGQLRFKIKLELRYTLTGTSSSTIEDYFDVKEETGAGYFERLFETYVQKIRRLLILGEPGSGKSILLLHFGLNLIEMAKKDPALPVPVILDLASWKGKDATFGDWLEANLPFIGGTFGISKDYAKVLRDQNLVLPLLDGFDEIRKEECNGCFEKLRTYLQEVRNSRAPVYPEVVICSRIWEYEMAADAPVAAVVMIQPLNKEDIQNTLRPLIAENDMPAKRLQKSLDGSPALVAAANSAFLLHTLLSLYSDNNFTLQLKSIDEKSIRKEIIEMYIQAELVKIKKYPPEKARQWLGWLAWRMKYDARTVTFELTDMQPWWAKKKFTFGLIGGLIFSLVVGLIGGLIFGSEVGLTGGLVGGLVGGLNYKISTSEVKKIQWSNLNSKKFWYSLTFYLVVGLIGGLIFGLMVSLIGGLMVGLIGGLMVGLIGGLMVGLIGGLVGGLNYKNSTSEIEKTYWYSGVRNNLIFDLAFGLVGGLIFGLIGGLIFGLIIGLIGSLIGNLVFGLVGGLVFGLVGGLVFGLIRGLVSESSFPKVENPYRRLTAQIWWDLGQWILIFSIGFGLGIYFGKEGNLLGFYFGLFIGIAVAILSSPAFRHFCLRLILWLEGVIPLHLVSFLNSASFYEKDKEKNKVGLLVKDGGQWRFRHQLILNHLADWFIKRSSNG